MRPVPSRLSHTGRDSDHAGRRSQDRRLGMASVLEQLAPASRVAVIRLRSLGDCVLTTPALEILKRARPDLRVAVVVEERFRAVFEGNPDIETLLTPDWRALRAWRPELCLNR